VVAAAGRFVCGGERGPDHHRVLAARNRLRDVAAAAHPAVRDHLHVDAGLLEMARPGARRVRDRGRLRHADAEHTSGGTGIARPDADEHTGGTGAHQVQGGMIGRATPYDDGDVELTNEPLQVERLAVARHVLGGDNRALDHEKIELGLEHGRG